MVQICGLFWDTFSFTAHFVIGQYIGELLVYPITAEEIIKKMGK